VVLIRAAPLLGQIDVDSDVPDPFTTASRRPLADALAVLL
jgi:hypothetical protein